MEQESSIEKDKKVFTDEQIKFLLEDDFLKPFAMKYLVDNADELNAKLTALNATIDEKIMTSFFEKIDQLKEEWAKIPEEMKDLPANMKLELQALQDEMQKIYTELDKKVENSKIKVETINSMALDTISKAMLNSSDSFERHLNDSKTKMVEAIQKEIDEHLKSKKPNPILTGFFGVIAVTSLISCLILIWLTFLR